MKIFLAIRGHHIFNMGTRVRWPVAEQPWVGRAAQHIRDPVTRLKFLKAVAPASSAWGSGRLRRSRKFWLLTAMVFVVMLIAVGSVVVPRRLRSGLRASVEMPTSSAGARRTVPMPVHALVTSSDVWLVEKDGDSETYSNGLRIDNRFVVPSRQRSYLAFRADGNGPTRRAEPAGIVFHTTESQQVPFEAGENRALKRLGESILQYVRRRRAYNFLIDRFGRVYRVVAENETANHAGYSAWADQDWRYINLNESFLGISFEAVSPTAQREAEISPAQVSSAAMLVEMLRHRYRIPASNCVTHAQISVNPANMRVGFHVDWAAGFPFEALGLPDNYATALPALWAYGFDYDPSFIAKAGVRMRAGIEGAESLLTQRAAASGLSAANYKQELRRRYRAMLSQVKRTQPDGAGAD